MLKAEIEEEFVEMEIKMQIPKTLYSSLEHLAKFVGDMTVKDILTSEFDNLIRDFHDGGFYESWTYIAMEKHDC